MAYKHPCNYCGRLVEGDSNVCPFCGKKNPHGMRCPKCRSPIEKGWKSCSRCGLTLETKCPVCNAVTFFGDYCDSCDAELVIICPNKKCRHPQPPVGEKCIKCGKPLK